jgi:hypothetical protein
MGQAFRRTRSAKRGTVSRSVGASDARLAAGEGRIGTARFAAQEPDGVAPSTTPADSNAT